MIDILVTYYVNIFIHFGRVYVEEEYTFKILVDIAKNFSKLY